MTQETTSHGSEGQHINRGVQGQVKILVYYESIKRELNKRLKFDSRCDARLKAEAEGCTRLAYTMWREEP